MEIGFLNKPTAMAYDSKLQLLAVGNKAGDIRMYSFCCCCVCTNDALQRFKLFLSSSAALDHSFAF